MKNNHEEVIRYIVNGIIATAVHYGILIINLTLLGFKSAGLASFIAAIFGVTISFFGSRYFVYRKTSERILGQLIKFSGLYGIIAVLHGVVLGVWVDIYSLSYNMGFILATGMQFLFSFIGNKYLIFKV